MRHFIVGYICASDVFVQQEVKLLCRVLAAIVHDRSDCWQNIP